MSDIKISALPGASTLTGAETIPLVQGGVTKKVTTDQFLTKDASGNVGVGTASTDARLTVEDAYAAISARSTTGSKRVAMGSDAFTDAFVGSTSAHNLSLIAGGNVGAVLTTSGNLGLGVTPSAWNAGKALEVGSSGNGLWGVGAGQLEVMQGAYFQSGWKYANGLYAPTVYEQIDGKHVWNTAPTGTAGNPISFTQAMTLNASGVLIVGTLSQTIISPKKIQFYNTGASDGLIESADDTSSFKSIGLSKTAVKFYTNDTLAAQFDASGNLLVGTTSTSPINGVAVKTNGGAGAYTEIGHPTGTGSGVAYVRFMYDQAEIGSIYQNGTSAVHYATSSDARLKENIAAADNGSALIDGLQVRKFDWKSDGSHQRFGFVAQELDAVYPEAVSKPADPDEMMGVDYSKLVPLLVQEIQSLRARVAALETV